MTLIPVFLFNNFLTIKFFSSTVISDYYSVLLSTTIAYPITGRTLKVSLS